jgi:hypothetical protein
MRRNVVNFIAFAIAISTWLYVSGPAVMYRSLSERGVSAPGVVVSAICKKSLYFEYRFQANAQPHTGRDSVTGCDTLKAGDAVKVVYLPESPGQSFYADPAVAYRVYVRTMLFGALLLSGAITVALHLRRQFRAKRAA